MAQLTTRSTCPYCGVGCGVLVEHDGARILGVRGDPAHPANHGRLCTKGANLHLAAAAPGRLLHPERRAERGRPGERLGWGAALDHAAERFAAVIRAHGPDAVGFYLSGQLLTEDYYVFNKLARGLVGTNNVDTNSRLCMSSAAAGYKLTLGADAPPCAYEDVDQAGCLFIAGANPAYAHPVLYRRIEAARRANPRLRVVVVDPRTTDTAREADLHLAIAPGSDVALFNAMLHVMLREGRIDADYIAAHTEGFDALRPALAACSPEHTAAYCGVPAEDIVAAARWFAEGPALSLYCQGLNQSCHGTDKNAALINLHLATGWIGRPGAGPFSLTGQPNAMGGREVGAMANLLSAHRDLADPGDRAEVARLWGVEGVPARAGRTAVELFEAARRGEVRALWIACTNPAHSLPDQQAVREALAACEFVVLQDIYPDTETAAWADLILPAAAWGEKDGTVTNSERRISRQRAAIAPPGEARADWAIAVDFARRLGARLGRDAQRLFPYASPEAIWNEHRETTRGRDLDITGLSYATLEEAGPQQWPLPEGASAGRTRLYADGVFPTPGGRARFQLADHLPTAEATSPRYPLRLSTGRLRDHWHSLACTGRVARLCNHVEEPVVSLHPADLARHGLAAGGLARVRSRRGELVLRAEPSEDVAPGQAWIPMHWGSASLAGLGVNALTLSALDPVSKQPELKHAAVAVEPAALAHQLVLYRRGDAELAARLRPRLARFDHASLGLYGRDRPVVVLRAAHGRPIPDAWLAELDREAGLDDPLACLSYRDASQNVSKRARLEAGRIVGVRLAGETAAQNWLKELVAGGAEVDALRPWLLAPLAAPPSGSASRGRIVCNCLNVSEAEITARIAAGADLAGLQAALKCGTECGSCVPEIKRMQAERVTVQPEASLGWKDVGAASAAIGWSAWASRPKPLR